MTFPEEIIDKIFEYERHILMAEHLPKFKYVLKDIEQGHKIILMDHDWYKRYNRKIDDVFHYQFPWKRKWKTPSLEGAALYIGRGNIICSRQVPEVKDTLLNFCHPYYRTRFSNWVKPNRREAKLINHQYFHH